MRPITFLTTIGIILFFLSSIHIYANAEVWNLSYIGKTLSPGGSKITAHFTTVNFPSDATALYLNDITDWQINDGRNNYFDKTNSYLTSFYYRFLPTGLPSMWIFNIFGKKENSALPQQIASQVELFTNSNDVLWFNEVSWHYSIVADYKDTTSSVQDMGEWKKQRIEEPNNSPALTWILMLLGDD